VQVGDLVKDLGDDDTGIIISVEKDPWTRRLSMADDRYAEIKIFWNSRTRPVTTYWPNGSIKIISEEKKNLKTNGR